MPPPSSQLSSLYHPPNTQTLFFLPFSPLLLLAHSIYPLPNSPSLSFFLLLPPPLSTLVFPYSATPNLPISLSSSPITYPFSYCPHSAILVSLKPYFSSPLLFYLLPHLYLFLQLAADPFFSLLPYPLSLSISYPLPLLFLHIQPSSAITITFDPFIPMVPCIGTILGYFV